MTDKPAHRVFHGLADDQAGTNARILVTGAAGGPTERGRAEVLYQLTPREPFWWGYGGGSPSRTAEALLDDVLPDILPRDKSTESAVPTRDALAVPFTHDFLAYFHDPCQFWLPAWTVARWVLGYAQERRKDQYRA